VSEEIERVLDTPLAELMDSEEERAHAEQLTRQADAAPAIARFRALVAFVGDGRRATQAGKLTPSDAVALARRLGVREPEFSEVRSMEDLPEVARVFHWALAAELLATSGTRIVAGAWCGDLDRDPLAAWFRAATVLLEHGVLDGFRRGWRKHYVEFLDASMSALLAAMIEAGGEVPISAIEDSAWEQVAGTYGYDLDDAGERRYVDRLVNGTVAQLAELGAAERHNQAVRLTELGGALATPRSRATTTSHSSTRLSPDHHRTGSKGRPRPHARKASPGCRSGKSHWVLS
jgi:hypothetical protein